MPSWNSPWKNENASPAKGTSPPPPCPSPPDLVSSNPLGLLCSLWTPLADFVAPDLAVAGLTYEIVQPRKAEKKALLKVYFIVFRGVILCN